MKFELFIESYGTPANDGENATTGLVIKMESESGRGEEHPLGKLTTGQWHNVSVPVSELNTNDLNIEEVNVPFAILPAWNASQAGIQFKFKNLRLIKD